MVDDLILKVDGNEYIFQLDKIFDKLTEASILEREK